MANSVGHILKSEQVELQGIIRLDLPCGESDAWQERNAGETEQQVRIIRNNEEFAVIEITCSCGRKTHVKCKYNGSQVQQDEVLNTDGQADEEKVKR